MSCFKLLIAYMQWKEQAELTKNKSHGFRIHSMYVPYTLSTTTPLR